LKLTREGSIHPITRLSPDERENIKIWEEIQPLDGINILEARKEAKVLLETDEPRNLPALILGHYGKGRVLILPTDYSWKWYMGMVAKGKGNWVYLRFIERMVRWLTKDPRIEPLEIILQEDRGEIGKRFEFNIKAKEETMEGPSINEFSITIYNPDGKKITPDIKRNAKGEYACSFIPEKAGIYRLRLETPQGEIEEFIAIPAQMEYEDPSPKPENLKTLVESFSGKIIDRSEDLLNEIESHITKSKRRFIEEKRLTVFSFPYIFMMIIILLGAEWYLRRRWGLK
jgi:hypothetical protein